MKEGRGRESDRDWRTIKGQSKVGMWYLLSSLGKFHYLTFFIYLFFEMGILGPPKPSKTLQNPPNYTFNSMPTSLFFMCPFGILPTIFFFSSKININSQWDQFFFFFFFLNFPFIRFLLFLLSITIDLLSRSKRLVKR